MVHAVVIEGAREKGFCAGGDIRALHDSGRAGTAYALDVYAHEYRLNNFIAHYPKPYLALMDGITMGGGVGVSVEGSHRVLTGRTVFAMPESGIGLIPDVGGSYFLPRLPDDTGLYLGLAGHSLKAGDSLMLGIGTHFVPAERLEALKEDLAQVHYGGNPHARGDGGAGTPRRTRTGRAVNGTSRRHHPPLRNVEHGSHPCLA